MRWEYPDERDADEASARQRIVDAMDSFWRVFSKNTQNLDDAFSQRKDFDVAGFTTGQLDTIAEGLCWEYGSALSAKGHRLVITPEGSHHLRPMVRELIRRVPKLAGWEFYDGRLPESPDVALPVAEQISGFKAKNVQVKVSLGDFRRINLVYDVGHAKSDENAATHYIFRASEQLLGEEILNRWVGAIELAPPQSLVGTLFSRRQAGSVSPDRLRATVDALISASREQLPKPPPRALAQRNSDSVQWSSYKLESRPQEDYPRRDDLLFLMTCEPELCMAENNDSLFYSGRYSNTGETFCYLKLERQAGVNGSPPIDSADARAAIEDALNAVLAEHGLGCTTGGGTGQRYAYIDLALSDVHRAIPIVQDLLRRRPVDERSWLLFFDFDLADEWVGIHEQTAAPPK